MLACSVYVDLNPVRAGVAETPEQSKFTSAFDRIQALQATSIGLAAGEPSISPEPTRGASSQSVAPAATLQADAWLCELTLVEGPGAASAPAAPEHASTSGATASTDQPVRGSTPRPDGACRPRASDQGYLPIELGKYLSLLDWTGRQLRAGKRGVIPGHLAPILDRLAVNRDCWLETVENFGRWFKRVVGRANSLTSAALRSGRRWFQGHRVAAMAFH